MNRVHGKTIFYPKWTFHSKVMTRNLFFCKEWATFAQVGHKKKKNFFSTSNVIISQSMHSTFVKLFAHVLLVV
jgi:hypothetical protein